MPPDTFYREILPPLARDSFGFHQSVPNKMELCGIIGSQFHIFQNYTFICPQKFTIADNIKSVCDENEK